jgi:hypothetical protein
MRYICKKDIAMTANVKIDLSNPMALPLLGYLESLPFIEVKRGKPKSGSVWQQALDEGAVTVDEFVDEMKARIEKWPDNA